MLVGVQPGPYIVKEGLGGAGPRQTARSLGAEIVRSNRSANADMRSALCWRPAREDERETKSSAYPTSETATSVGLWEGMWKWVEGSVMARVLRAMSKNAVQACGLETSP